MNVIWAGVLLISLVYLILEALP